MYERDVGSFDVLTQAAHVVAAALLTASNHYCHSTLLHGPVSGTKYKLVFWLFFCSFLYDLFKGFRQQELVV